MNTEITNRSSAGLSEQLLENFVREVAGRFQILRKVQKLFWEHQARLRNVALIPSTNEEMLNDWCDACAFVTLKIVEGDEISFTDIGPQSYRLLEDVWLRRVKQLKAYYVWENEDTGDSDRNYFKASEWIRTSLFRRRRASLEDFQKVKEYIEDRYLTRDGKLDENKVSTKMLICRKAHRIWEVNGDTDHIANWFRARRYVAMFYENFIGAVVENDAHKTVAVLKAFEFSKAPSNRYLIIDAFETVIAIYYLNKNIILDALKTPRLYDLSMEPVDDWPEEVKLDHPLRYERDAKQLIYEGVMSEEELRGLMQTLKDERHRVAVVHLFQQSQLRPFEEMIL